MAGRWYREPKVRYNRSDSIPVFNEQEVADEANRSATRAFEAHYLRVIAGRGVPVFDYRRREDG